MKHLYIVLIVLTLLVLCALVGLYFLGNINIEQMLLITAVMNGIGIIGFCIIKILTPEYAKIQQIPERLVIETPVPAEEAKEPTMASEPSVPQQWSKAMHRAYADRWNEVFEKIKHPIEETSKSEINVLCWEIASKTMDYLLVENDDPNVLERNRNCVDAVLSGKKLSD